MPRKKRKARNSIREGNNNNGANNQKEKTDNDAKQQRKTKGGAEAKENKDAMKEKARQRETIGRARP